MTCLIETERQHELLLAYCAGKLDPETTIKLELHLLECPACMELSEKQSAVWTALDAWRPESISAEFDIRLYEKIKETDAVPWYRAVTRASAWRRYQAAFRVLRHGL